MKIYNFVYMLTLVLLAGCKGCDPDEQFNNGNDDPSVLLVEITGTDIASALYDALDCQHPFNFTADVEISVRTASWSNGVATIDPNPFFEFDDEVALHDWTHDGTIIPIEVPESGAYAIWMEVEMHDCSLCCHGTDDRQCGTETVPGNPQICKTGKPQVAIEKVYRAEERPPHDQNWHPTGSDILVRICRACSTCQEPCG